MTDTSDVDIQDTSQFAIVSEDVLLPIDDKSRVVKEENVEHNLASEEDEKHDKIPNTDENEAVPNPSVSKTEDANAEKEENEDLPANEDIKQQPLPSELQQPNVSSEEKENENKVENENENEVENEDENEVEEEVENDIKLDEKPKISRTKLHSGILKKKSRWLHNWRDRDVILYETSDGRMYIETYILQNHQKVEDSKEEEEKIIASKEIFIDDGQNSDTDNEDMNVSANGNGSGEEDQPVRRPTDRIELDVNSIESQVEKISFHVAKCEEGFVFAVWEMRNGQRKKEFLFRTESKKDRDQWFNILINISENGSGNGCGSVESETQSETLLKDTLNVLLATLRKVEGMRMLSMVDGKSMGYYSSVVVENENMKTLEECEKKLGNVAVGMNEILEIQRKLKEIAERDGGQVVDEVHLKVEEEENNI